MAHVSGERAPVFTAEELEKLVDGVLPQYTLLYGPPDKQMSTQYHDAWAMNVWIAVCVSHMRSIHCRKRLEDQRRWAKKTAEAQLGLASQRGRGACRTITPLMFRILVVAYPELDGRLKASQQPQGARVSRTQASTSATKSASAVVPATPRGSKGEPVRPASVPPTPAKDRTILPPAMVKKRTACSKGKEHDPPRKASSKTPAARAKVPAASAKVRKGQKSQAKALQASEAPGEGLVATIRTDSPATSTAASTASIPAASTVTCTATATTTVSSSIPSGQPSKAAGDGWCLPPPLAAPSPAPALPPVCSLVTAGWSLALPPWSIMLPGHCKSRVSDTQLRECELSLPKCCITGHKAPSRTSGDMHPLTISLAG
ncbi:hypothetical protein NDU88_004513 [Pleurodeles waltl]|uniref:Uncharacterized protein n=1 Tax=Pleurodeles waltl TaxID=8319 RepID=A0AAV7VHB9_PLEWA|nr:hypothetical protein NDU88_004513 [Pleurodeles waltl]